jgi:uncharacterized membrane protein YphA (DoxX/SURF4 family)
MDHYRNPHVPPPGLLIRDVGLLILRWCAGLALILFHAWDEVIAGWKHVWEKTAWPYAVEIAERGFPLPEAVAFASAVAALLGSMFLVSGLLCRISALILLLSTTVAIFLYGRVPDLGEKLVLYAGIYLVILICGPGRFSLDAILSGRRTGGR